MDTIIKKLNDSAATLTEADLDKWIVPEVLQHYQSRIDFLSSRAYNSMDNSVATMAFREMAKSELKTALQTFLFKAQHWKSGRDINPYLMTSLTRLADRTHYDHESAKKANLPICPLCKEEGRKEFLCQDGKLWRCEACAQKMLRLSGEIKNKSSVYDKVQLAKLNTKCNLYRIFSLHSRKGYKCIECSRFIPESINTEHGISCPYDDCIFFGTLKELETMPHPAALTQRQMISLQSTISNNEGGTELSIQDSFEADVIQADVRIDVNERNQKEYDTLMQVITDQIITIKRMNSPGTLIQKLMMYEAYKLMLQKYPEEMISYLVHQKQNLDFPIQARIFQEYAGLVENCLPFAIKKRGAMVDIVDLTDPNLSLFLGISKFEGLVKSDHTIPNNTKETYTGGRKFKNYGSCFIGKLIDITDASTGSSIQNSVKEYSFVNITLDDSILPGTPVVVTHFRIPSHYEMDSLVFLQRIRRQIVDSVYFRLNKKKRIPRGKE